MAGRAVESADTPTANNATYQLVQPVRVAPGHRPHRLPDRRANQRIHGRYLHDEYNLIEPYGTFSGAALPTVPTNRSAAGHQLPDRAHLGGAAQPDQRSEDQRGVERPAHQAAGRLLAARHLSASPSRSSSTRGRFVDGGIPNITVAGFADADRAVVRAALADDRHHGQDTLTWMRGAHSIRSGVAVSRNRKDQNGRGNYFGRSPSTPPATRTAPATPWPTRCSATSAPTTRRRRDPVGFFRFTTYQAVRLRHLARPREPVDRGRRPLRAADPDLHAAEQPGELRSGPLRPGPGGAREPQRPPRARRRQSLQRPRHRRRRASRRISRGASIRRRTATTGASRSGRRAASTRRSTCSCRASAPPTR